MKHRPDKTTVIDKLRQGLLTMKCIRLEYDGIPRLIEIHTLGFSKTGRLSARVYQIEGGSMSGEKSGWKMMTVDKMTCVEKTPILSAAPREGYKRGDLGMSEILEEI